MARGSAENPRGASASDTILLTDIEVTNDTLDKAEAYGEATLVGQVQYQLESQNPQVLKATAVMYHRDYLYYDAGDLSSLQTMVEYQRLVEPTLTFGAKFNLVAISEETYSATQGGYAEIGHTFWGRLKLNLYAETSEAYNFETSARSGARDYNGITNRVNLSATTPIFGQPVKLTGGYKRSDPEAEIYQYTSRNLQVSTSWQLRHFTASLSGGREWVHYRVADPLISSVKREDVVNSSSVSVNVPLTSPQTSLTAKASYSSAVSSLDNYDKDSADFQMALNVTLN